MNAYIFAHDTGREFNEKYTYRRFTFFVVELFSHIRRDMKIILMKIYSMQILFEIFLLKFHLKLYYVYENYLCESMVI